MSDAFAKRANARQYLGSLLAAIALTALFWAYILMVK